MKKVYISEFDIPMESTKCFEVDGLKLMAVQINSGLYVTSSVCPHKGGDLCKGKLSWEIIECPVHHLKFNVVDGSSVEDKPFTLPTYKVHEDSKGKYIEIKISE